MWCVRKEGHGDGMEEDHSQFEQNWKATAPDKWDTIVSGNWIQKTVWNRMVTVSERDQPHKTPVTSTWTADFLTREGEGRKEMGDWLRDKTVKHPDGICGLCKHSRENWNLIPVGTGRHEQDTLSKQGLGIRLEGD